jgi:hypothetical protein
MVPGQRQPQLRRQKYLRGRCVGALHNKVSSGDLVCLAFHVPCSRPWMALRFDQWCLIDRVLIAGLSGH